MTATADTGWIFTGQTGEVESTDNPLTITMEANTSITATFIQIEYTLTVTTIGFGSIEINPAQSTYYYGEEVTILATLVASWVFDGWSGDAIGTENPLTIMISVHNNITATFITYGSHLPLIII